MSSDIGWTTTLVGQMPKGERASTRDVIEMAVPILWEIGGTDRFRRAADGFHITALRCGNPGTNFGEFFYESRSIALDLGFIRAQTGTKWRRYTLGALAHEMVHARQFLRGPVGYRVRHPYDFPSWEAYYNSPGEVEARKEESLVRQALGLTAICSQRVRGKRKERLEKYTEAFSQGLLPILKVLEAKGREGEGGSPVRGIMLPRASKRALLEDLRQYVCGRRLDSLNEATRERLAKVWRYSRGWHLEEALEIRTVDQKSAWLEQGGVRRSVRAHLDKNLPAVAESIERSKWTTTIQQQMKEWDADVKRDEVHLMKARLAGLEQIHNQLEEGLPTA